MSYPPRLVLRAFVCAATSSYARRGRKRREVEAADDAVAVVFALSLYSLSFRLFLCLFFLCLLQPRRLCGVGFGCFPVEAGIGVGLPLREGVACWGRVDFSERGSKALEAAFRC